MAPLIVAAFAALEDGTAAAAVRSIACSCILAALTSGLEVPPGAPMAAWRWLIHSESGASALHLQELPSAEVAIEAIRILKGEIDAGENARDLAMAVMRGENLAVVRDADIVLMAERAMGEGRLRRFVYVIEGVHELRGLSSDFIRLLRDRLSSSPSPAARAAGVEIGALLPRVDLPFLEHMLVDPSPVVRRCALEMLERVEMLERTVAATVVRRHLSNEQHRSVIASGLTTLGSLVRREPKEN